MNGRARAFIALIISLAVVVLLAGLSNWESSDSKRFIAYLAVAVLASALKVGFNGASGMLSFSTLFLLLGLLELSFSETLLMAVLSSLVFTLWRPEKKVYFIQVLFNISVAALAVAAADVAFHSRTYHSSQFGAPANLLVAALSLFSVQTIPVAIVVSFTEGERMFRVWGKRHLWMLPYYMIAAAIAALVHSTNFVLGWQMSLLIFPAMYLVYRSYCLFVGRLSDGKEYAEGMASLHLRTIEALAMAIEAKDNNTHEHLQRVQIYAVEIGRELGLKEGELEALRAASLLHDIGKLAVPEHIISKPGKLTPEEFEKMKIHPVVGAEILERVKFPHAVVPIVRHHHERWDGKGYPDGLREEQIPIGARILSVVDCLDALASNRQYRRAMPLHQAMGVVEGEAGKAYDPKVVAVLKEHYIQLEHVARAASGTEMRLSTEMKVERGEAPAAGFQAGGNGKAPGTGTAPDFLMQIAAARQEAQALFEIAQTLGNSLSLDETLSVLAVRLKKMIPHDALAVYILRDGKLRSQYATGDNFRLFSMLEIPVGQGLSGWVAESRRPILNGNPSVEPGYLNDPTKFSTLRSALAVPLEGLNGVVGVLTLYHADRDRFLPDHLRILQAISSKLSIAVENALKYQQAETSATTDFLTGLPNARSLFLHLEAEINRCRRTGTPLTLLVCDLDGFKDVNDRYGHLEGNRILREVAVAIKTSCRDYDYVARMGGDEFVVVMPGLPEEATQSRAEKLQQLAETAGRIITGENVLTMSIGDSHFPHDGEDAEQLLAEADRRMYAEKQKSHSVVPAPKRNMIYR
jgi:diguanylate cyclase (GGDEF)-like protein/putative nucleotidyltransferase with HDIG domain